MISENEFDFDPDAAADVAAVTMIHTCTPAAYSQLHAADKC